MSNAIPFRDTSGMCCQHPNLVYASAVVSFLRFPVAFCEHCSEVWSGMNLLGEGLFRVACWVFSWHGLVTTWDNDRHSWTLWERFLVSPMGKWWEVR